MILIAARSANGCIGKNNELPWPKQKQDMEWFREQTLGKAICMGRNTFESIGSRPLPKRFNIIVSRSMQQSDFPDLNIVSDIESLPDNCICIGGQQLYEALLPRATKILLTTFNFEIDGDAWFPDVSDWKTESSTPIDNGVIQILVRN